MEGDTKAGFSVFWADDGLDTGPVLLQRECDVDISDTVDTLYSRFLMPEGIRAMVSERSCDSRKGRRGQCVMGCGNVLYTFTCACHEPIIITGSFYASEIFELHV